VSALRDLVDGVVAARGWSLSPVDEQTQAAAVEGEHGSWLGVVQVFDRHRVVALYSVLPVEVAEDRHAAMAELVTRANHGLIAGAFELDLRDGEVRFRSTLDVSSLSDEQLEAGGVVAALVGDLLADNLATADRYLPAIKAVAAGEDPLAAVAATEAALIDLSQP
jgi:hypothetical protein